MDALSEGQRLCLLRYTTHALTLTHALLPHPCSPASPTLSCLTYALLPPVASYSSDTRVVIMTTFPTCSEKIVPLAQSTNIGPSPVEGASDLYHLKCG